MSPSSALANRSFLYGGSDRLVYATLDSLALKRATLPLKLVPTTRELAKSKEEIVPKSTNEAIVVTPKENDAENDERTKQSEESEETEESPKINDEKPRKKSKPIAEKKVRREFAFAKNVLHYVPMTSRRYYHKSRKLASKSLSLKSLGNVDDEIINNRTLKTRSLSRDELKYVSISMPSDFRHVASMTRKSLMTANEQTSKRHIVHEGKYADLRGPEYAEIAQNPVVNQSFLWSRLTKVKESNGNIVVQESNKDDGDYDDVGPPVVNSENTIENNVILTPIETIEEKPRKNEDEQDAYDDVGVGSVIEFDEQLYDDVMPLKSSTEKRRNSEPEPSVDENRPDEDVYDDVGLPLRQTDRECHERVNSLYAGSTTSESMHMPYNYYDKESEWEDLDETAIYGLESGVKLETEQQYPNNSPSKKKPSGQRWSRKIRRQRSRASRKSSGRSTSRSRNRVAAAVVVVTENRIESSDDSNYETLETYEPDDFSSDSETENSQGASIQEPPSRPVPPPPREASLGHSLGRRMKMLRRTWSITKGSLGRMRRRASGECDPSETPTNDARKYFSFKKHFRKNQTTALSTFYLDKADKENSKSSNSSRDSEPIYANSNYYQEAGLYSSQVIDTKHEEPVIDHYSVLAEEPLYQFYAAAATRVAFESDSDGYEEVEELTPSAATTDLAKPGHRTLWCQTPQVINSGLLQSLTMEERKIQEAKFEILTSEASYLNSLRVLENEFASNYELVHEILSPAEREKLFGAVPDVLVASERFLAELETIWREDPMLARLPELLLKHGERSSNVYVDYCSNQVSIDVTLKELKSKKGYKFLETVSRIELHPACQSLSLHSFLMLPMQRITRLPLLADAVLSKLSVEHNERLSWERVLAALSHIVAKCNEGARQAERRNEMDALARKLEYSSKVGPIDLRERELIRSGTVVHLSTKSDTEYKLTFGKKFHKTPLMLMLLTDYLLVTKLKTNFNEETYSVIETCKRSLVALESAPEDSPFAGRHAMVLTLLENHAGRQVEYVLTCENDTEKERWLDAVSPPKPTCVGETLYESWDCPQVMAVYSYSPTQPDELTLQPGDVINVLRKMNDGWLYGEKLLDGEQGWFPGNFTKEVASEHVRARNLRQRHRFLALSGSVLQKKAKQSLSLL